MVFLRFEWRRCAWKLFVLNSLVAKLLVNRPAERRGRWADIGDDGVKLKPMKPDRQPWRHVLGAHQEKWVEHN